MNIKLPKLPEPDFTFSDGEGSCYYAETLRARDIEVAKAVLEAAAVTAWTHYMNTCKKRKIAPANFEEWLAAGAIRALEIKHD